MDNNRFASHTPRRSQQLLLSRQPLRQPAQPDYSALQHPHSQAPLAPADNPQWTGPPPEQNVLYTDYNHGPQLQGPQHQYQQHQHRTLPLVAQPPPYPRPPAVQPGYNPYQSTAGYHLPHAVPSPQLPYDPHLQQQQQKRLHHPTPQRPMPVRHQVLEVQHLALPRPKLPFKPPPPLAQASGRGDGTGGPNNMQLSANEEDAVGNRGGMSGSGGGDSRGNRGEMARSLSGSHMGTSGGDGKGDPFGGGVHAHGSEGNFRRAASMQAGGCDQFLNIAEPATVPVATQFEGAQGVTISGHPIMTNIGMNTGVHNVTTVNHYGGTHGLENLKDFVSFAALHNSAAQDPERRCHPGTRENVLKQLRCWIDNPNATDRIFWLHGPAGAGKSAIAQTIAHAYKKGEVAATFFFFRSDATRNDGNRLFPTIVWQLALSIPATKNFIIYALNKTPHLPLTDVESQFEQLVAHVFQPMNNISPHMWHPAPVVIIDGVDECSDEHLQRRVLAVIGNAVKGYRVPLRFLLSSRPEALIEETLNHFHGFTLRIDLATLDDSNRDIEKYLMDKFSVIASKQGLGPSWPSRKIIEEIVFKSSGNFILASTLVRFIGDEDYSAVSQLDIVRKLKPRGAVSPFALLDELYLEILKQPRDQDFLKTFLALLLGRSSVGWSNLHEDDAMLMDVSEKELHIKLRRMRSLLKLEPFIDVYHKSFLDFLQDSSRSGQYHVSKQDGQKRYLRLIVNSVVQHVSMAIEESNQHETCRSSPEFRGIVRGYPPKIVLPVEDWQESLKPLLDLQDRLLKTSKSQPCRITQIMRDLQLHLVILQKSSHDIAAATSLESNNNTERSPALVTEAMKNIPENDLDRCLSGLLSCVQKTSSVLAVDTVIIERMSFLLAFDHAETAARVRSVADAQKLIDIIDLVINNEYFLGQCGLDAVRRTCRLVSEIFARVPVLPQSLFLNEPTQKCVWFRKYSSGYLEYACSSAVINRCLSHNYTVPTWFIYQGDKLNFVHGNVNEQNQSIDKWLERTRPNFVTRIQVMLEVARTIRYLHSMGIVTALISSIIKSAFFTLDSNLRAKIVFVGAFAWQVRENLIFVSGSSMADFTYESNIFAFADLFYEVCYRNNNENPPNHLVEDARQLIERCRAKDPKSRPTMEDVVKEMETWDLT